MTEEEAREEVRRIAGRSFGKIARLADLVFGESYRQNLISRSSADYLWSRHILDSAQLAAFARPNDRSWADIGTGAGFPGLVLAMLDRWDMILVEPRRRRAEFLEHCISEVQQKGARVLQTTAQRLVMPLCDIVSARAVASVADIFGMTRGISQASTRFIIPKGQRACEDVEGTKREWQGMFHVEQSLTSPESRIVIADQVRPR